MQTMTNAERLVRGFGLHLACSAFERLRSAQAADHYACERYFRFELATLHMSLADFGTSEVELDYFRRQVAERQQALAQPHKVEPQQQPIARVGRRDSYHVVQLTRRLPRGAIKQEKGGGGIYILLV